MKYVILGPTASGKTAYAISLAKHVHGAVVSADSRQVFAGMNIGTAKPREAWSNAPHAVDVPDVIEGVPHYLLNIASVYTPYTLSDWLRDAKKCIAQIVSNGQIPIITGGTMLYIDGLVDGYDIPQIEPNQALRAELEKLSPQELYKELLEKDPETSTFIEPHNSRRIIRALEVIHATGKKFSDIRKKNKTDADFEIIGIFESFEILRDRISTRAETMIHEGLANEIAYLQTTYPNAKLLQTMNYKEDCDIHKMAQSNMRYAHRQMSWWKRRTDISWICA
ncbi:MAG: tRNA (adenosine(37)-N6)-dimethylallyltransferase MiaA [bacterium]|nr:tRNA (adenosine(37)-N6)-dimethylallyltransferase MiaA [bacterium]